LTSFWPETRMPDLVLSAADGSDSLALTDPNSVVYLPAGSQGLDLPPQIVIADANPFLPGSRPRAVRDDMREIMLPLLLSADTITTLWAARRRLFAILRPANPLTGCVLTATDPFTGVDRSLTVLYAGGAEGDLSTDNYGRTWQKYALVLRAPDPYWYSTVDDATSWTGSAASNWFPIFPLTLTGSQILSGSTVAGTTNLFPNPSAEIDLTGWGSTGGAGDPTPARDTTRAKYGSVSVRYDYPAAGSGGGNYGITVDGLTVGLTYTVSVWVWVPTGVPTQQIAVFFLTTGSSNVTNNAWERLTVTFAATGTSHYVYVATVASTTLGQQIWVDAWQAELGSSATAYCDGDQSGCSWAGVPHASISTREAAFDGVSVNVLGDASTWPRWTIVGPATSVLLVHFGQNRRLGLVGSVSDGSVVTIDTRPGQQSISDDAGNNLFGRLTIGFSLFALDPGRNDISVALTGTTANSAVSLTYTPRWSSL
jgi:Phage tail protein